VLFYVSQSNRLHTWLEFSRALRNLCSLRDAGLVIVALIGSVIAYRGHRKVLPLILGILSTLGVLYSVNTDMNVKVLYFGLIGLIVVAVWNSIEAKRCADACKVND
jgi:hypothetical protein